MCPRSAEDRISAYTYGINPDRLKEDAVAGKPKWVAKATTAILTAVDIEARTKAVLATSGAATNLQMAFYITFAKELSSASLKYEGAQLVAEAAVLIGKWHARGLDDTVLADIRTTVFTIPSPVAP